MNRPFFVPAMVLLTAAAVSLQASGAGASRLPEAAPLPQEAGVAPPVVEVAPVLQAGRNAPFPVGWEDDVYCAGWIGEDSLPVTGHVVAAEYEDSRTMFGVADIIYTDVGARDGLLAGQEFQLVRPAHEVYRIGSAIEPIGRFYDTPARARVVCVQETTAILEITDSCEPAYLGDLLIPFEPIPIPLVRASAPLTQCDPPSGKTLGHIVEVKDRAVPVGTDSVVFLDLGDEAGIFPGDFLSVWRPRGDGRALRTYLGEVAVLWTRNRTCVAKVTSMIDTMGVGDFVELK